MNPNFLSSLTLLVFSKSSVILVFLAVSLLASASSYIVLFVASAILVSTYVLNFSSVLPIDILILSLPSFCCRLFDFILNPFKAI